MSSPITDTTSIPKHLQTKKTSLTYLNYKYFGSEIGYKYAIKTAIKKTREVGISIDPNPFIVFSHFPVKLDELDTNNTTLSFIIR